MAASGSSPKSDPPVHTIFKSIKRNFIYRKGKKFSDGDSMSFRSMQYDKVRVHHVLALYCAYIGLPSLGMCEKIANKILSYASSLSDHLIPLIQKGFIPDFLIRYGIRLRLSDHLVKLADVNAERELAAKQKIVGDLSTMPIAIATEEANEQHYEVPAKFYDLCLGPAKKYSSGLWLSPQTTFEESEELMLDLYCERANITNGVKIVDLGCGWGSLTLHLIAKYPDCKITSISNSSSQREYIYKTAKDRGLNFQNITIVTCNVADDKGALDAVKDNDVVMTVEMFEHMKNYDSLLKKVHKFLKPTGKLFVHIFTHKDFAYHFEKGWMSDNFFTGGTMPSDDLLLYFARDFAVLKHWRVNGTNYEKTSNGWLTYLDKNWKNGSLKPVLAQAYGEGKEREWYTNWRLFFLACAELWGYNNGEEWIVSHYLFEKR